MFLIRFGCDPDWVLNLDMLSFNSLVETAMRLHSQQMLDEAYTARLVAHDEGPRFSKHLKGLKKAAGLEPHADGDDLMNALSQAGNL